MQPTRREEGDNVLFGLTLEDRDLIDSIKITGYGELDEQIQHEMCIMQVVRMLELGKTPEDLREEQDAYDAKLLDWSSDYSEPDPPEGFTDDPICVSEVIIGAMIAINDSCEDEERDQLKELIPGIMNTCPVRKGKYWDTRARTEEYSRLEDRRRGILGPTYALKLMSFDRAVALVREAVAIR